MANKEGGAKTFAHSAEINSRQIANQSGSVEALSRPPFEDIFYRFNLANDKKFAMALEEIKSNLELQQIFNALYRLMKKGGIEDLQFINGILMECLVKINNFNLSQNRAENIRDWTEELRRRVASYAAFIA